MELEALVDPHETAAYAMAYTTDLLDPSPLLAAIIDDLRANVGHRQIAARFHNGIARMVIDVCRRLQHETGLTDVVLSGGVWQNMSLLQRVLLLAEPSGLTVYTHQAVPANDGGLALGQAAIAAYGLRTIL